MKKDRPTGDVGSQDALVGQAWMALCKGSRTWASCKNMGWLVQSRTTESGDVQPYMMIDMVSGKMFQIVIVEV